MPGAAEMSASDVKDSLSVEKLTVSYTYPTIECAPTSIMKTAPTGGYCAPDVQESACDGRARHGASPFQPRHGRRHLTGIKRSRVISKSDERPTQDQRDKEKDSRDSDAEYPDERNAERAVWQVILAVLALSSGYACAVAGITKCYRCTKNGELQRIPARDSKVKQV